MGKDREKPELNTKSKAPDWDRIVDIHVDKKHDLSPWLNDANTYKILILKSGSLCIDDEDRKRCIVAPSVLLLSEKDRVSLLPDTKLKSITVYFKPTVIHDNFTYHTIEQGEFKDKMGTTLYSDYLLIDTFENELVNKICRLSQSALTSIMGIIYHMDEELCVQTDGYWPCRSRSRIMELLFYLKYSCFENRKMQMEYAYVDPIVGEIIQYLHEHIHNEITLTELTKQFSMNRNRLNALFTKQTGATCLEYFLQMKMDLAKIMLTETELPIGELGERVGFLDTNYFTKVFKKKTNMTPSQYRKALSQ